MISATSSGWGVIFAASQTHKKESRGIVGVFFPRRMPLLSGIGGIFLEPRWSSGRDLAPRPDITVNDSGDLFQDFPASTVSMERFRTRSCADAG